MKDLPECDAESKGSQYLVKDGSSLYTCDGDKWISLVNSNDYGCETRANKDSTGLIIYCAVRSFENNLIVTNGDQTDTIRDYIEQGKCYRHALLSRTFEPDGPNWTPRVSGVLKKDGSYNLSILKSLEGDDSCCCRYFYEYDAPKAGTGHFISTYVGFGEGAPGDIEAFIGLSEPVANAIWEKFLPIYLGTDDPERLKEVEDKARVLSYTRRLRHMIRRGADKTEEGKKLIALCANNLSELVKNIDTLEF